MTKPPIVGTLLAIILFISSNAVAALDEVKWPKNRNKVDPREQYKRKILLSALERTKEMYGDYTLERVNVDGMTNTRAREIIRAGEPFNISSALTSREWESETIPIRIPIRRGILNYRLLLIKKGNEKVFHDVNTLEDLKQKKVGLRIGWSTTKIFDSLNFSMVKGLKYDGLFVMLDSGRFDYIPRGINEIYNEILQREQVLNLGIEPNLAIYLAAPTYFFVSPKMPSLAERLELGLEMMVKDGTLRQMFQENYSKSLEIANIKSRKIIKIENTLLPPETPLHRKELWFEYDED